MIASLPMYARASNRAAHDALWALIRDSLRDHGVAAPDHLDHDIDHIDGWQRDDLVLSQICNLPYRARFRDQVTLIGAADYDLADCPSGYYRSAFVVRADSQAIAPQDMAKARFVCNDTLSQSGYGAPQLWAEACGFQFRLHGKTGGHNASIAAIANGKADIAAIDAQSWWIEERENALTAKLKVIGYTDVSPGQTFVTRKGEDPAPYFAAITEAITALPVADALQLNLKGIIALPQEAYDLPFPQMQTAIHA